MRRYSGPRHFIAGWARPRRVGAVNVSDFITMLSLPLAVRFSHHPAAYASVYGAVRSTRRDAVLVISSGATVEGYCSRISASAFSDQSISSQSIRIQSVSGLSYSPASPAAFDMRWRNAVSVSRSAKQRRLQEVWRRLLRRGGPVLFLAD